MSGGMQDFLGFYYPHQPFFFFFSHYMVILTGEKSENGHPVACVRGQLGSSQQRDSNGSQLETERHQ